MRQPDPVCDHSLGGDRPSEPPDHWNSVWLCDPKTKNPDHKTAQRFPDREEHPRPFCGHPARKHCGSDFLENRSDHSGTNVQHRSRCSLFCRCSDLHDVYAVWHTGLRCFLSQSQRLVSRRKRSAESIGFVHPDRTDHLLHHSSGFIRLHHFRT